MKHEKVEQSQKKKKDEQSQSTKAGWWKHQEHNQSEILWYL